MVDHQASCQAHGRPGHYTKLLSMGAQRPRPRRRRAAMGKGKATSRQGKEPAEDPKQTIFESVVAAFVGCFFHGFFVKFEALVPAVAFKTSEVMKQPRAAHLRPSSRRWSRRSRMQPRACMPPRMPPQTGRKSILNSRT